jgi:hypothetical protein
MRKSLKHVKEGRVLETCGDADHLTPQFLIVIQKSQIENISIMDGAMLGEFA